MQQPVVKTVEQLGLPIVVGDLACFPRGLVVVTGDDESARSSTIAAMVNVVNEERAALIMTLADPMASLYENKRWIVEQRRVGSDSSRFAGAAEDARREGADVIVLPMVKG